jgi:branched-chain amino acid transport system permease protein
MRKFTATPSRRLILLIVIGALLIAASYGVDELRVYQMAQVAVFVVAISSIVLLTGYSGQISLGHGAIMAIGAYATVLSYTYWHIHFLLAFFIGGIAGAITGFILGIVAARLSGPYLAGSTLALAVGLPSLANQFHILGGEQGLQFDIGNAPAALGQNFTQYKWFFWVSMLITLALFWLLQNLLSSRYGRSWRALRTNPMAAALSGVNVSKAKVLAFTLSSALAGFAGALFAMLLGIVTPLAFTLTLSFTIITGAVLAGVNRLASSIIGAVILVSIPEISGAIATHLGNSERITSNLPGVITGVLLIVTVLFAPNGPQIIRKKRLRKPV